MHADTELVRLCYALTGAETPKMGARASASKSGKRVLQENKGIPPTTLERHMDIMSLVIQLLSGAAGGNVAGALLKNLSLGTVMNSVVGILGGGIGGQILSQVLHVAPAAAGSLDIGSILTQVAGGGVGGGGLLALVGLLKSLTSK
jgi:uncharacterized membrane protein YeaQ/YmgE (transglycosylase-associated protein family)